MIGIIQIRSLKSLDRDRFHDLASGYISPAKYNVKKVETEHETIITMRIEQLEHPYLKKWDPDPSEGARYEQMVQKGFSAGAYDGDLLVGISIAEKQEWNRTFVIWEFHIDKNYQLKGVGRQLMEHRVSSGREIGCRVVVCETQNTNVPAIQFYRKVGFEIGAVDLSYYTNEDTSDFEVAIFMKRYIE